MQPYVVLGRLSRLNTHKTFKKKIIQMLVYLVMLEFLLIKVTEAATLQTSMSKNLKNLFKSIRKVCIVREVYLLTKVSTAVSLALHKMK